MNLPNVLPASFYDRDAHLVARELLGAILTVERRAGIISHDPESTGAARPTG